MDEEKGKFQYAALRFLYDMELVDDPRHGAQLINNLKLNVLAVSPRCINDVEFLTSHFHRAMLVYVDLNWLGRRFFRERIETQVHEMVAQLLPKMRLRVTSHRVIFDMALKRAQDALKIGDAYDVPVKPAAVPAVAESSPGPDGLPQDPGVLRHSDPEA